MQARHCFWYIPWGIVFLPGADVHIMIAQAEALVPWHSRGHWVILTNQVTGMFSNEGQGTGALWNKFAQHIQSNFSEVERLNVSLY